MTNRNAITSISILSRFDNPHISKIPFFDSFFLNLLIVFQKIDILRIFNTFLDVKSERNNLKGLLSFKLEISFDVIEKCFFVADVKIALKVVMHFHCFGIIYFCYFLFLVHFNSPLICILTDFLLCFLIFL